MPMKRLYIIGVSFRGSEERRYRTKDDNQGLKLNAILSRRSQSGQSVRAGRVGTVSKKRERPPWLD